MHHQLFVRVPGQPTVVVELGANGTLQTLKQALEVRALQQHAEAPVCARMCACAHTARATLVCDSRVVKGSTVIKLPAAHMC